jgi:Cof subfamily protein (haloacid dehalogenase superfamily)
MIKLIAIDLDGTLMDSQKQVSPANVQAIQRASQQGIRVVLISARPPFGMTPSADRVGLDEILIAYNGAYALEPPNQKVLIDQPLTTEDCHALIHILRRHDLYTGFYAADQWFVEKECAEMEWEAQALARYPQIIPDLTASELPRPHKMILIDLKESGRLQTCFEEIRSELPNVNAHFSGDRTLEINDQNASKSNALSLIARRLGFEVAEVAALGDGENDVPMLKYAGLGVAMGNAPSHVQAQADMTVASNDHNGVAQAIETILQDR